jgi:hypothetical protein
MNVKQRLKKLESNNPNKPPCFCNKTWVGLCFGEPNADALTYCANCKDHFDYWARLARDAETSENLTNI